MADQTLAQSIDECRQHLMGNARSEMNVLNAAITTTTQTTLVTTYPLNGITPGTFITIDDEEFYVFATDAGDNTVTVSRGENSSQATEHLVNARIYVNEPFDREMILNAIISDVRSWGPQVYQVQSLDITTIAYQLGYDLGDINPFYDVLDVRLTPPPTFNVVDNLDWKRVRFKVLQNQNTTDFPSGNALILTGQGMLGTSMIPIYNYANYTQQLHVVYSTPFNVEGITEQSYLGADIGIDETEFDIPALGAAWRLMSGREARRATTLLQGDPGATEQVPPMYIAKVAEQFKIIRDSRLGDAEARLMRKYPWRMTH